MDCKSKALKIGRNIEVNKPCCYDMPAKREACREEEEPRMRLCDVSLPGGTVHMVCRNKDKAEEARADIVKESGNKVAYPLHPG